MIARRYRDSDYETLCEWMNDRERRVSPAEQLPPYGWIVEGIAYASLMRTDCSVAFIENFVTNKKASKEARLAASDLIFQELEKEALGQGFKVLAGYTSIYKVLALGGRYGMKAEVEPHWLFRKVLNQDAMWSTREECQALRA